MKRDRVNKMSEDFKSQMDELLHDIREDFHPIKLIKEVIPSPSEIMPSKQDLMPPPLHEIIRDILGVKKRP